MPIFRIDYTAAFIFCFINFNPNLWVLLSYSKILILNFIFILCLINFSFVLGELDCKINNDKINVQKVICRILKQQSKLHLKKTINYDSFSNIELIKAFFKTPENFWLFKHLKTEENNIICQKIVDDNDISFILNFVEVRDIFEKIVFLEYKSIATGFSHSKNATLTQIDFSTEFTVNDIKTLLAQFENKIKTFSLEIINKVLIILKSLPIAFCSTELKTKVTLLHLCLYKDLMAANQLDLADDVLELLLDIFHFGEKIALHKYITFNTLLNLVSPKKYPIFYTTVFNNLKLDVEAGTIFIETVVKSIKQMDKEDERYFELLNLSINYLSSPFAPKNTKKFLEDLHIIVWENVENNFKTETENNSEESRAFVTKSLPSFCNYFLSFFNKLEKNAEMDESMRKICKIYIGNSVSFD